MAEKKTKSINLLPQEEFESSVTGRVLKWAMTTFRYIVIVTELIVMGAFLSRFWLDAKNSDLNDALKVSASEISLQKDFEKQFRDLQGRLKIFKEMGAGGAPSEMLNKVIAKIPDGVSLQSLSFQDIGMQVKGISASEIGVAQFVSNLKTEKGFKKVDLGQIQSSETNSVLTIFTISITY